MAELYDRRTFLTLFSAFGISPATARGVCASLGHATGRRQPGHPEPRKGITSERVLEATELTEHPEAITAFNEVRQIPHIVDGIRCHCGCAELPEFYSLLSCYEGDGMAQHCEICRGQGRMAFRLSKSGKSLAEIRVAIDDRYG